MHDLLDCNVSLLSDQSVSMVSAFKQLPSNVIITDDHLNQSWTQETPWSISTSKLKAIGKKYRGVKNLPLIPRSSSNGGTDYQNYLYGINVYSSTHYLDLPDHISINPRKHQLQIIDAMVSALDPNGIKNLVICQSRSAGKTEALALGILSVVTSLLSGTTIHQFKIGYIALTQVTVKQVADLVYDYLSLTSFKVSYDHRSYLITIRGKSSTVTVWFVSMAAQIRGKHADYLILDEYAFYRPNQLASIQPITANVERPIYVYCSTPCGDNHFKTVYDYASDGAADSGEPYQLLQAKFSDLRTDDVQDRFRDIMTPSVYEQEMQLSFNAMVGSVFPYQLYHSCFVQDCIALRGKVWVGMDPARGADGRDYFGIAIMDEDLKCLVYQFNGKDANVTNPAGYDLHDMLMFAFKKIRPYFNRIQHIFIEDQNPTISDKIAPVLSELGISNSCNGYSWFVPKSEFSIIKLSNWHGEGKRQSMLTLYKFLSDEYEVDKNNEVVADENGNPVVKRHGITFNQLGKHWDHAEILYHQFGHFIQKDDGTLGNDDFGPKDQQHDDVLCALAHCVEAYQAGSRKQYTISVW